VVRRDRYDSLLTAPCINACPAHVDIPAYLEHVKNGRWVEAMTVVRNGCPMPGTIGRVCVRPCEENCRRNSLDAPLAIRGIKRFLADREQDQGMRIDEPRASEQSDKVAIVGAGPAGLSCAYYLGRLGYRTTVFEAQEGPGGMAAYGIPSYRLPRDVIAHEVTMVEALGAEIRYGVTVGKDISMDELEDQGYQAIFLGAGAPESSAMRCTGEEAGYQGFMPGIDFLARAARGNTPLAGKRVVVIGGGNVAMDCVRTARRLGFEDVNLLYRRTEREMPADRHEIREAKEEGVTFHFLVAPLEIMAENGVVTGLKCQRMGLGEPDASGRRRPMPIDGSEFVIDCDAVIPAVGQKGAMNQVISGEDCVTSWNTLMVDEATFQSARPQVFGGGDCATGPASLIAALAAGRKAAGFIDQYLKTRVCCSADRDVLEHLVSEGRVFDHEPDFTFPGGTVREEQPVMEPDERICDFQEVEKGFSAVQARIEASRCLRCYRLLVASF
jgi:formate dehydrogenase beta subunit